MENPTSNLRFPILPTLLGFLLLGQVYGQSFNQVTKAVASDRSTEDYFGKGAAVSGNYAIIGAIREDHDATGGNIKVDAGSAYIFEKDSSGNWNQVQKLVASDRAIGDLFGGFVDISGNYAIVGAELEDEDTSGMNTLSGAGAAYIFERDPAGVWVEKQKIVASDREGNRNFGKAVAISGDRAIVGTPLETQDESGANVLSNAGAAYIFERDGSGMWTEVEKIVPSDREAADEFGSSVSIFGDYALVGAYEEDDDLAGMNNQEEAGSAYLFERDGSGNWNQVQKLIASDRWRYERFGYDVAVGDGVAFVGSLWDDEDEAGGDSIPYAGSVYIFTRDGGGTWSQHQKIVPSDRSQQDFFGSSVSFSGDLAVIAAYREDEDVAGANTLLSAGSAYIFEQDVTGTWNEIQKIVASDRAASDEFGWEVSISGNDVLVSAWQEDEDAAGGSTQNFAGSAYFFGKDCSPAFSSFSVTECESYTVPSGGLTYSSPGTYSIADTVTDPLACDSIFFINLTILPPKSSTLNDTLCDGDSLVVNGTTYNAFSPTGTEIFTGIGPFSCDSTVSINLTILPPKSSTLNDTLCDGDSLVVNGTTYNAFSPTGTEIFTGIGPFSCDSTVSINLTILPPKSSTLNDTLCDGDSLVVNGTTYNAFSPTGTEVFPGIGTFGCDSTVSINLTILPPKSSTLNDTLCDGDSLVVNGTTYNALSPTGTEVFPGIGTFGCDSTVSINLTILPPKSSTLNDTLCDGDSLVVNGTTYNALSPTGTEVFPGIGTFGCDSTVSINLTILPPKSSTLNDTLCDGDSLVVNGTTYNALSPTGTEVFPGIGTFGCDSTVSINLTILPPKSSTLNDTLCDGDSLVVNGTTYNALSPTGTEVFPGIGTFGCDSTVSINLTILPPKSSTLNDTLCDGDSLVVNGTTYNALSSTGTEVFPGIGTFGCDSTVFVSLSFWGPLDTSLSFTSPTLTSNQPGATYQWIDCSAGDTAISGATSQSYTATANGAYAVILSQAGCLDTSTCQSVVLVGREKVDFQNEIDLYPNPTREMVTLQVPFPGNMTVKDLTGKSLCSAKLQAGKNHIRLSELDSGLYLMQYHSGKIIRTQRLMILK